MTLNALRNDNRRALSLWHGVSCLEC